MDVRTGSRMRGALAGASLVALVVLPGCARVKPEQLSEELARLRQEMTGEYQQGDARVAADLGGRIDGIDARLDAMAGELERLGDSFDVTVERLEGAVRFNAPVFFTFDDATLREADRPVLDRFAEVVRTYYPDAAITAEGFTDPSGNAAYNRALGKRRADAVAEYLATQGGLEAGRLRTVSYGEDAPRLMDSGRGPGDKGQRNRRVVLVIEGPQSPETARLTTNE